MDKGLCLVSFNVSSCEQKHYLLVPTSKRHQAKGSSIPVYFSYSGRGTQLLDEKSCGDEEFDGIEVELNKILISHLQFVDNTVLIGEASLKNAMCSRGILRFSRWHLD